MSARSHTAALSCLLLVACALLAFGCGKESSGTTKTAGGSDPLREALASIPLSNELSLGAKIEECDPEEATQSLDEEFALVTTSVSHLWDNCQALYACSPIAKRLLKNLFAGPGASFKVGFGNLKGLGIPHLTEKVGGLYVAGTGNIYVDFTLKTPRMACHILLHEIVHRFDPNAQDEESLRTEYRAYWYQAAFIAELYLNQGSLGLAMREGEVDGRGPGQMAFHTRRSLLEKIAEYYAFAPDYSIIEDYPRLPFERASRALSAVKP